MVRQSDKPTGRERFLNVFVRFFARPFFNVPHELDAPQLAAWYLKQISNPPSELKYVAALASLELDMDLMLLERCVVPEVRELRKAVIDRRGENYSLRRVAKTLWIDTLAFGLFRVMLLQARDTNSTEILFEVHDEEPHDWTFSTKLRDQWKPAAVFPAGLWDGHVGLLLLCDEVGLDELWDFYEFLAADSTLGSVESVDKIRKERPSLARTATIIENAGRRIRVGLGHNG